MTNEVAKFNPGQMPAYLRNMDVSPLAKALAGTSSGFARRLSIKGGVFRLIVEGKEVSALDERWLDIVIVNGASKVGRQWYSKQFSEDSNQAPSCWSTDGNTPDSDSLLRQHENCRDCPKNIKGSGQGDTRACRFTQRLAVVLANDIEGELMQLSVPAKSIFGDAIEDKRPLQAYAKWLLGHTPPISPDTVITRLRFDTAEESPKLHFKTMRFLEEDEHAIIRQQASTQEALDAIAMSLTTSVAHEEAFQQEAPPPAPKAVAAPKQPPVTPSVQAASDDEPPPPAPKKRGRPAKAKSNGDDTPEPTVRTKPEAPRVPQRSAISDVVDEWGPDD